MEMKEASPSSISSIKKRYSGYTLAETPAEFHRRQSNLFKETSSGPNYNWSFVPPLLSSKSSSSQSNYTTVNKKTIIKIDESYQKPHKEFSSPSEYDDSKHGGVVEEKGYEEKPHQVYQRVIEGQKSKTSTITSTTTTRTTYKQSTLTSTVSEGESLSSATSRPLSHQEELQHTEKRVARILSTYTTTTGTTTKEQYQQQQQYSSTLKSSREIDEEIAKEEKEAEKLKKEAAEKEAEAAKAMSNSSRQSSPRGSSKMVYDVQQTTRPFLGSFLASLSVVPSPSPSPSVSARSSQKQVFFTEPAPAAAAAAAMTRKKTATITPFVIIDKTSPQALAYQQMILQQRRQQEQEEGGEEEDEYRGVSRPFGGGGGGGAAASNLSSPQLSPQHQQIISKNISSYSFYHVTTGKSPSSSPGKEAKVENAKEEDQVLIKRSSYRLQLTSATATATGATGPAATTATQHHLTPAQMAALAGRRQRILLASSTAAPTTVSTAISPTLAPPIPGHDELYSTAHSLSTLHVILTLLPTSSALLGASSAHSLLNHLEGMLFSKLITFQAGYIIPETTIQMAIGEVAGGDRARAKAYRREEEALYLDVYTRQGLRNYYRREKRREKKRLMRRLALQEEQQEEKERQKDRKGGVKMIENGEGKDKEEEKKVEEEIELLEEEEDDYDEEEDEDDEGLLDDAALDEEEEQEDAFFDYPDVFALQQNQHLSLYPPRPHSHSSNRYSYSGGGGGYSPVMIPAPAEVNSGPYYAAASAYCDPATCSVKNLLRCYALTGLLPEFLFKYETAVLDLLYELCAVTKKQSISRLFTASCRGLVFSYEECQAVQSLLRLHCLIYVYLPESYDYDRMDLGYAFAQQMIYYPTREQLKLRTAGKLVLQAAVGIVTGHRDDKDDKEEKGNNGHVAVEEEELTEEEKYYRLLPEGDILPPSLTLPQPLIQGKIAATKDQDKKDKKDKKKKRMKLVAKFVAVLEEKTQQLLQLTATAFDAKAVARATKVIQPQQLVINPAQQALLVSIKQILRHWLATASTVSSSMAMQRGLKQQQKKAMPCREIRWQVYAKAMYQAIAALEEL